ncbi:MAG: hypothetical protein HYU52_16565 [Acidobacteria bacterium]|nr:hypothetical protein [Acidobacteriota bacterium]
MTQVHKMAIGRKALLALAATILALAAQVALAQGTFYVEEEKDGRIYVFNNMKSYEMWKTGGELGVSITRPGEGPNGETMVFDTDEAIHLYNFKHGRPGEVLVRPEPAPKPVMKFAWKDGKTTFESDKAALAISNRVQVRWTEEMPETGDDKGSFRIRRAKTKFEGWFYSKNLTYELQTNWADTASSLEDANINYDFFGTKGLMLKAGQFKVPFGRQELTSSGSQQFVDRSLVSGEFAKGRDAGVQLWGMALNNTIDWRIGAFNGAGRNKSSNDNTEYQYNARVTWQPFGDVKYSESDFESKDKPLFALALQWEDNDMHGATSGNDNAREIMGGDVVFKYKGLSVFAETFYRDNDFETGADTESEGVHYQIGYLFPNRKFELAARFAQYDPNVDVLNDAQTEKGIAGSWYWNKHSYKLQGDYRQVENNKTKQTNDELRVQLQFIF